MRARAVRRGRPGEGERLGLEGQHDDGHGRRRGAFRAIGRRSSCTGGGCADKRGSVYSSVFDDILTVRGPATGGRVVVGKGQLSWLALLRVSEAVGDERAVQVGAVGRSKHA